MADIDEIRRANPDAAADLEALRRARNLMDRLRAAGLAKGTTPLVSPHAGRYGKLPKSQRRTGLAALKMTLRA